MVQEGLNPTVPPVPHTQSMCTTDLLGPMGAAPTGHTLSISYTRQPRACWSPNLHLSALSHSFGVPHPSQPAPKHLDTQPVEDPLLCPRTAACGFGRCGVLGIGEPWRPEILSLWRRRWEGSLSGGQRQPPGLGAAGGPRRPSELARRLDCDSATPPPWLECASLQR